LIYKHRVVTHNNRKEM